MLLVQLGEVNSMHDGPSSWAFPLSVSLESRFAGVQSHLLLQVGTGATLGLCFYRASVRRHLMTVVQHLDSARDSIS